MIPWSEAWQEALYGSAGFYRETVGPAGHFTTSTHAGLGTLFAEAIGAYADGQGLTRVLDFAAGRGELLTALAEVRGDLELVGCDIVDRPRSLPDAVRWVHSPGGALVPELGALQDTLVVANEWLDVVPCPVLEFDDTLTPRVVLVDPATGEESLGGDPDPADLLWVATHWPRDGAEPGDRIEVGRTRDEAWALLAERVRSGVLLGIDYGHTAADRPPAGTLVGYREGHQVLPVPDGSCDLTAHVATDSLLHDEVLTQRAVLGDLVSAPMPAADAARSDPVGYIEALSRHTSLATLRAIGGLGDFHWVSLVLG